jgi:acetylglutamate kinase
MIPKVQAALTAADGGTRTVVLDGRRPHALRESLAGGLAGQRGTGTLIG